MKIESIRGLVLEEIILHLLQMVGYRLVEPPEDGNTRSGKAGTEVRGRGAWHQIDVYAAFDHTPAFVYPLRMLMEAKCYKKSNKVGVETVRNAVGVLKDIAENYFSYSSASGSSDLDLKMQRFNFVSAIFSASGFSKPAQEYAIAHQIFLIQYENVFLLEDIIKHLMKMTKRHFQVFDSDETMKNIRNDIKRLIVGGRLEPAEGVSGLSLEGETHFLHKILPDLMKIEGSYFGMIQGKWPVHLLSRRPLPNFLVDTISCKIHGRYGRKWSFVPSGVPKGHDDWFQLEFDLPDVVSRLIQDTNADARQIADIKEKHFSYIYLSGKIEGVNRYLKLELDLDWLNSYRESLG